MGAQDIPSGTVKSGGVYQDDWFAESVLKAAIIEIVAGTIEGVEKQQVRMPSAWSVDNEGTFCVENSNGSSASRACPASTVVVKVILDFTVLGPMSFNAEMNPY